MTGTGLDDERAYLAECETAIRRMVEGARLNVVLGERVAGDRYSAERLGYDPKSLAKKLDEQPDGPPFFGRLDFGPGPDTGSSLGAGAGAVEHHGQRYYIGRRHISGGTGRAPMVIDWRAPVSTTFYRVQRMDDTAQRYVLH